MISLDHIPHTHYKGMRISVIYAIVHISSKKKYIGGTQYGRGRIAQHFRSLRKNEHFNCLLQADFNKYGEDSFRVDVLKKINLCDVINPYGATMGAEESFIKRARNTYNFLMTKKKAS